MTDSLERFVTRNYARLREAAQTAEPPVETCTEATEGTPPVAAPPAIEEEQEQRARRVARYEEVMALHAQGQSMRRSRASRD